MSCPVGLVYQHSRIPQYGESPKTIVSKGL